LELLRIAESDELLFVTIRCELCKENLIKCSQSLESLLSRIEKETIVDLSWCSGGDYFAVDLVRKIRIIAAARGYRLRLILTKEFEAMAERYKLDLGEKSAVYVV
jgi:hypothetical protein